MTMNKLKYGMPTLVECADIFECAEVAAECGLDFIEMNLSFPQYQPQKLDIGALKRLMAEKGIFFTIHADESMNPFDFNSAVSKCYFENMREAIRFAKALEIPVINLHLLKGVYVTLPDRVILLTDVYREEYMARVREFIDMCEAEIGDAPLKIAIENVDSNPFTKSQTEALILFMQSDVFALTLDVGHDDCLDGKDRHVFLKYPHKLAHMHLHDSDGRHPHLPLGAGHVNIEEMLQKLDTGATCLVEVKTIDGLRESMKYLKEKGIKA